MSSIALGFVAFGCLFSAALVGVFAQYRLPDEHLASDSKDAIKLATAVIGTLSALALGLLISSAKSAHETAEGEVRTAAAHLVLIDRVLARYGAETGPARQIVRELVTQRLQQSWGDTGNVAPPEVAFGEGGIEQMQEFLRTLTPATESQKLLRGQALELSNKIAEDNWAMMEAEDEGLPAAFLIILILWLSLLFATFGLLAPRNVTVVGVLCLSSLSVAAAIYLIADMSHPYLGLITISDVPLKTALSVIGK